MAGDWIKLEAATPDKPEMHEMAEMLELPPEHILGACIRVWLWADQQFENSDAVSVTLPLLDRVSNVVGMGQAMQKVGWLKAKTDHEGVFSFNKFHEHNGKTAKNRALTARRMFAKRLRSSDADVTKPALPREEKSNYNNNDKSKKEKALNHNHYRIGFDPEKRSFTGITDDDYRQWQSAYAGLAIPVQVERAAAWLMADWPGRRKVKYGAFLVGWFNREQQHSKGGMPS